LWRCESPRGRAGAVLPNSRDLISRHNGYLRLDEVSKFVIPTIPEKIGGLGIEAAGDPGKAWRNGAKVMAEIYLITKQVRVVIRNFIPGA
jgi:hypothetical protein